MKIIDYDNGRQIGDMEFQTFEAGQPIVIVAEREVFHFLIMDFDSVGRDGQGEVSVRVLDRGEYERIKKARKEAV